MDHPKEVNLNIRFCGLLLFSLGIALGWCQKEGAPPGHVQDLQPQGWRQDVSWWVDYVGYGGCSQEDGGLNSLVLELFLIYMNITELLDYLGF